VRALRHAESMPQPATESARRAADRPAAFGMTQRNVASSRASCDIPCVEPTDPASLREVGLWNRETLALARDMFVIGAILFYVIGFAYQTAKMQWAGFDVNPDDQRLTSLFRSALEALHEDALVYAAIAAVALGLLVFAAVAKRKPRAHGHCPFFIYAIVAVSALASVGGSSWIAWRDGCVSTLFAPGASEAQRNAHRSAPRAVSGLSETPDTPELPRTPHDGFRAATSTL